MVKGDQKLQVGALVQSDASGIAVSYDHGLGENISIGLLGSYVLGVSGDLKPDFDEAFDLQARFNANIGNVINIDDNLDIYPGLHLGLKNFGTHLGVRYFFSNGFGVYTEVAAPIAKYKDDIVGFERLNNQFTVNLGAVFSI